MKLQKSDIIKKLGSEINSVLDRTDKDGNKKSFSLSYLEKKFSKPLLLLDDESKNDVVESIIDTYFRKNNRISVSKGLESYSSLMLKLKYFFNNELLESIIKGYDSKSNKSVVTLVIENAKDCIDTIEQDENNKHILINKDNTRILPSVNFTDLDARDKRIQDKK